LGNSQVIKKLEPVYKLPETEAEAVSMLNFDYFVDKLAKCKKEVYVDSFHNVKKLKFKLRSRGIEEKRITLSKHPFGLVYETWFFSGIPWSTETFLRRIGSVMGSGIVHLWAKWEFRIASWNDTVRTARNESSPLKAISTEDNFVVVFYFHICFLGIGALCFCLENRRLLVKLVHVFVKGFFACFVSFKTYLRKIHNGVFKNS